MRHGREQGLTLVEVLVTAPIILLIVGAVGAMWGSGSRLFGSVTVQSELTQRAIRALDRVSRELSAAGTASLTAVPKAPYWTDSLALERLLTVGNDGSLAWEKVRVAFAYDAAEANDGKDNDRDGLVDEGELVFTLNQGTSEERRVVLCRGVREYLEGEVPNGKDDNGNGFVDERGFCFSLDGAVLRIRLSVESRNEAGTICRTAISAVGFRN